MTGRNYIVMGANGGIGSETCRQLRAAGSQVLLVGRNEESLSAMGNELDSPHRSIDATAFEQVEECFVQAAESLGQIHGILNCVSRNMHAVGRLGEPKDIASLLVWILQRENDWVTGQVFGADGGLGTLRATNR